ncbi:hypothetical protein JDV02_008783 [Purpureocillium takamizusanense]|nr:uncharacterized protein JDV02_008783 [Purpureocillium takamizusanense]UNI22940.1 hypothetical protein JDV02_008783 [Purpureocillium takamizusanense]
MSSEIAPSTDQSHCKDTPRWQGMPENTATPKGTTNGPGNEQEQNYNTPRYEENIKTEEIYRSDDERPAKQFQGLPAGRNQALHDAQPSHREDTASASGSPTRKNKAVEGVTDSTKGEYCDVTTHVRPAVVEEHIRPHVHTIYEPTRTRSIHIHEHKYLIQPIKDPQPTTIQEQHWLWDPNGGQMQRISLDVGQRLMGNI